MNTTVAKRISADSQGTISINDIEILGRKTLRKALIMKHGTLTEAARKMGVSFQILSDTVGGRREIASVIHALQSDLGLTDDQVKSLWPLLRSWPREIN